MASGSNNNLRADNHDQTKHQNGSNGENQNHRQEKATYVFMDLEATSLMEGRQRPRIIELCLLAVHRSDLHQATRSGSTPRIVNKLTLCFDPQKPMSFGASEITGLYNDSLEGQSPFCTRTARLINAFLDHLAKPVCLIAHNGNRFDFPLLRAEFKRIKEEIGNDILCVDSLEAFRSLDGLPARHEMSANQNHRYNHQGSTPKSTQIVCNKAPAVKRKSDEFRSNNSETNIKQAKMNIDQFDVDMPITNNSKFNADKVKKKLFSDGENSNTNNVNTNSAGLQNNTDNKTKTKKSDNDKTADDNEGDFNEFSSSLEDDVLISALDEVENQASEATNDTHSTQESTKDPTQEMDSMDIEKSRVAAVEASTGYFVCKKAEKGHTPETNVMDNASTTRENEQPSSKASATAASSSSLSQSSTTESQQSQSILSQTASASAVAKHSSPTSSNSAPYSSSAVKTSPNLNQPTTTSAMSTEISPQTTPRSSTTLGTSSNPLRSPTTTPMSTSVSGTRVPQTTSGISPPTSINNTIHTSPKPSGPTSTKSSNMPGTSYVTPTRLHPSTSASTSSASTSSASTSSASTSNQPFNNSVAQSPRLSYKLDQIYIRKFGSKPGVSHSAEDDCVTMLKISCRTPKLMDWLDLHAVELSSIEPGY